MTTSHPATPENARRVRFRALLERECGTIYAASKVIGWRTTDCYRRTDPILADEDEGTSTRPLHPDAAVQALRTLGVDPCEIFGAVTLDGDAEYLRWMADTEPTSEEAMGRLRSLYGLQGSTRAAQRLACQGLVAPDLSKVTSAGLAVASGEPPPDTPPTIRELRLAAGLTQDHCAFVAGFSRQAWSKWERKGADIPAERRILLEDVVNQACAIFSEECGCADSACGV